jgi:hypothetical protein
MERRDERDKKVCGIDHFGALAVVRKVSTAYGSKAMSVQAVD